MRRVLAPSLCTLLVGTGLVALAPVAAVAADPPASCADGVCRVSYASTGALQTFTIPSGVESVTVTVAGGQGGSVAGDNGFLYAAGGAGGRTAGTLDVEPGEVLTLVVGGAGGTAVALATNPASTGSPGGYGGGGAGGDDVRPLLGARAGGGGGSFVLADDDTLLLAAGGGGGAAFGALGGLGGGASAPATAGADGDSGATGGRPGTAGANGSGGAAGTGDAPAEPGGPGTGTVVSPSVLPVGGTGGDGSEAGGGGGGGYRAGGGGGGLVITGPGSGGAGGGGAGYADASATGVTSTAGATTGGGTITVSWELPAPTVTISAAPTSSTYGDPVVLSATVTGGAVTPTGRVEFRDGSTVVCASALSGGSTTCTTSTIGAGTVALTAAYVGDTVYGPATSAPTTVTVDRAAQSLAFTSDPPRTALPRRTYQATAQGLQSTTPVTFAAASASGAVCTVSATGAVRFVRSGVCVVEASQPATRDYEASPTVTQSVTVSRIRQRITFRKPAALAAGGRATLRATSPSGAKITFTSLTTRTCAVRGNRVSAKAPGTCTVKASVRSTPVFAAATARQAFKVRPRRR